MGVGERSTVVAAACIIAPNGDVLQFEISRRYDTRCYFNVRSKANMSQPNLPHGTDN